MRSQNSWWEHAGINTQLPRNSVEWTIDCAGNCWGFDLIKAIKSWQLLEWKELFNNLIRMQECVSVQFWSIIFKNNTNKIILPSLSKRLIIHKQEIISLLHITDEESISSSLLDNMVKQCGMKRVYFHYY